MKALNDALISILASREYFTADLYVITLATTEVLRYASGQTDITFNGNVYSAGGQLGPYFDRKDNKAKVVWRLGSGTDSLVIDVVPGSALVKGVPFLTAARIGEFDGADFQLYRAFMSTYGTVQTGCALLLFQGRIAEVDADRSLATFTVNDYRELFSQQLPRNLYQAQCANTLGDASCTVNLSTFSQNGTVASGTTAQTINCTGLTSATGFFDLGKVTFTSGQLVGLSFGVSFYVLSSPSVISLVSPLPALPNAGDTFTIFPGCDRTLGAQGCAKYSNQVNFRGFPYVPAPETAA